MLPTFFLICWQAAAVVQDTVKPLPDAALFIQQVRKKLRSDRMLLSQYTYTETATARELDKAGKVKKTSLRVFEVYPSLEEEFTARLNKGASMTFQRRRVNNEIWLPAEAHFSGAGRLLLVKGLRIDASTEFSDYRKFTVETSVKYSTDKKR